MPLLWRNYLSSFRTGQDFGLKSIVDLTTSLENVYVARYLCVIAEQIHTFSVVVAVWGILLGNRIFNLLSTGHGHLRTEVIIIK